MTVDDFNALVQTAYQEAFAYLGPLSLVYEDAYARQTDLAVKRFKSETMTAAWTPPVYESLTDGMSEKEKEQADRIRDQAAAAIVAAFATLGIVVSSPDFMEAISQRAQTNFEQEIMRQLRTVVSQSFDAGLSAEATAAAIREKVLQVIPSSAQMLAETMLTTLVNERSIAAAQKAFPDGVNKTWLTVGDNRVRAAHSAAEGQTVPVDQPFSVGGASLMYPGDPTGPLRLVARCRCRLSYTDVPAQITAAARPDVSQLAMVAVYPTPDEAEAISTAGGNPPETMHVTMVFLGEVGDLDLEAVARAVEKVASFTPALSGRVGGIGMFQGGPDGFPQLAIPNVSGLAELRTRLTDALAAEGVSSPSEHDWVPHMTLAYVEEPSLPEDLSVIGKPLTFDSLSLAVADARTDFPFASAQEDTLMPGMETNSVTTDMFPMYGPDGEVIAYTTFQWPLGYTSTDSLTSGLTVTITEDDEVETPEEDKGEGSEEPMPMADGPPWRALLAVEGVPTEDGRMLAEGSLKWRDLPLSLTAMDTSNHGEPGPAKVAGRIDRIWRDGNEVWGEGVFNSDEFGTHIYELVSNQSLRGNSIEPAVLAYEVWDLETMQPLSAEGIEEAQLNERPLVTVFTDAIIMCSTVVATPALGGANIVLASGLIHTIWFQEQPVDPLTASAAGMVPLHPPAAWFERPNLMEPTPLTITEEGQVFGHAALWNSCHIGEPSGPGICVPPPRSGMNYEIFHHGACRTAEGHDVVVGQLTLGTLHAGRDLGWRETMQHYEHSGLAFADVHAYEDRHGIVVVGALRPDVPATKVREAKAGALSGDWRQVIGRGLEFLAALVVNVPGFPIPRPEARIVASASGEEEVLALVAAGMVEPAEQVEGMSRTEYLRKIRALTDVEDFTFAISAEDRRRMAKSGVALPDGSFPIPDCDYAERAIRAQGRANPGDRAKVVAHIRKRVKALGCSGDIFDRYK